MTKGFLKMWRSILDHPIWLKERFTGGQAWVDLLLLASHKTEEVWSREKKVVIHRGEIGRSIGSLATRWKWNIKTVRRFLEDLKDDGMVAVESDNRNSVIKILNYEKWQNSSDDRDSRTDSTLSQNRDSRTDSTASDGKTSKNHDERDSKRDSRTDSTADKKGTHTRRVRREEEKQKIAANGAAVVDKSGDKSKPIDSVIEINGPEFALTEKGVIETPGAAEFVKIQAQDGATDVPADPGTPKPLKSQAKALPAQKEPARLWSAMIAHLADRWKKEKGVVLDFQGGRLMRALLGAHRVYEPEGVMALWDMWFEKGDTPWNWRAVTSGRSLEGFLAALPILLDDPRWKAKKEHYRRQFGSDSGKAMRGLVSGASLMAGLTS